MSEPSEAAKAKACELANAAKGEALWEPEYIGRPGKTLITAFARFIQEVSDAAKEVRAGYNLGGPAELLAPFILPDPVDLELLHEADLIACGEIVWETTADYEGAKAVALAALKRGIELAKEQGK